MPTSLPGMYDLNPNMLLPNENSNNRSREININIIVQNLKNIFLIFF